MKRKMNMTKSRKALSPVVASIILIAVTVAVSIAVAAWMGALTFSFTETERVNITNLTFDDTTDTIAVTANNTGTNAVTINEVWVNGLWKIANADLDQSLPASIAANAGLALNITMTNYDGITAGNSYQIKLVSSKGNQFLYTGTAPT